MKNIPHCSMSALAKDWPSPTQTAANRPICADCAKAFAEEGVKSASPPQIQMRITNGTI